MSRQPGAQSIKILINHWRWLAANGYKKEAASCKRQAASLTRALGYSRMNLERNNYGYNTIKKNSRCFRRDPETSKTGYAKV